MAKKNKQAQGMKKQQPAQEKVIVKPRPDPEVEVRPEASVQDVDDFECRLPKKDFFTIPETAVYLELHERTVRRYIQHGKIALVEKHGQTPKIPRLSIIRYRLQSRIII